jgi:endonuclease-3
MAATLKKKKTTKKKTKKGKATVTPVGMKLPRKSAAQKKRAAEIFEALRKEYPEAHCELDYKNPMQLLVSTILSAQATDVGVNKATPALFKRFKTPHDFAAVEPAEIEPYIASIGLFRNKAKAIREAMRVVCEKFDGQIPDTMEGLLQLRGVARKTANVVLGNAFGKNEGVVVDTHVARLSQRLGLTKETVPAKIEKDLMALFDRENWCLLSHLLVFHGRRACKARGELCAEHPICKKYCSRSKELRAKS